MKKIGSEEHHNPMRNNIFQFIWINEIILSEVVGFFCPLVPLYDRLNLMNMSVYYYLEENHKKILKHR